MFDSKNYHRTTQHGTKNNTKTQNFATQQTVRQKVVPRTNQLTETNYSILFPTLISMFFPLIPPLLP